MIAAWRMFGKTETGWGWAGCAVWEEENIMGVFFHSRHETFRVGIRKEIRQTVLVSESSFDYNLSVVIKKERNHG
jgi:hypothetical protein